MRTEAVVTRRQIMVVAAARQIRDGEIVFVGMRLPLLGFAVAKATHAPRAVGLFENGVIRDTPPAGALGSKKPSGLGRLETSSMLRMADPASCRPALRPTRGSGALAARSCAPPTRTIDSRAPDRHRRRMDADFISRAP